MSGGPAEIALLKAVATGAATGAATSAITGGDPLKGALVGSFINGVGGAFGGGAAGGGAGTGAGAGAASGAGAGAGAGAASGAAGAGATTGASALEAARASTTLGGTAPGFKLSSAAAERFIPTPGDIPDIAASMAPTAGAGVGGAAPPPGILDKAMNWYGGLSTPQKIGVGVGGGLLLSGLTSPRGIPDTEEYSGPLKYFKYDPRKYRAAYADGGITDLDLGNTSRMPSDPVIMMRSGGISDLGDYSDGGRLLKGPGDGVSDSIPARIGQKREARLADGEFVVPARIVSELGNGSTDAGARQLYAMMDRIQARRRKTVGKGRTAVDSKARKLLPA